MSHIASLVANRKLYIYICIKFYSWNAVTFIAKKTTVTATASTATATATTTTTVAITITTTPITPTPTTTATTTATATTTSSYWHFPSLLNIDQGPISLTTFPS